VSCAKMEKLKFDGRIAEAEAKQQHSARRLFLEFYSPSSDMDGHLLAFIEELVVEAEMKRTRSCMALHQHTYNCPFLLTRKFKLSWHLPRQRHHR